MKDASYFKGKKVDDYAEFTVRSVALLETHKAEDGFWLYRQLQIARLDELPEADTSDLVRAYEYQRTIDENYEQS